MIHAHMLFTLIPRATHPDFRAAMCFFMKALPLVVPGVALVTRRAINRAP